MVEHLFGDNQFEPLRARLEGVGVRLNTPVVHEHVPDAEREIRTLKEHVRGVIANTPYRRFPPRMVVECVVGCNMWKNAIPPRDGIHRMMSPRTLVTGSVIPYGPIMRLAFEAYAQVPTDGNNTMLPRTVGAVAMRPMGNAQGGARFFALDTGRIVTVKTWTTLPITKDVIDRVHRLARRARAAVDMGLTKRKGPEAGEDDDVGGGYEKVYEVEDGDAEEKSGSESSDDSTYYEDAIDVVDSGSDGDEDHRSAGGDIGASAGGGGTE